MDQEAFRKLLSVPKQGSSGSQRTPAPRGSLLPSKHNTDQQKTAESSKSVFKPRNVKKQTDSNYRDRAAERRVGAAGDFAEVESVLENFEKQHAGEVDKKAVEEQRRYLGGDSEHTVLVKGLDFALLEQTRARAAASTSVVDDADLEEAFHDVVAGSTSPPPPTSKKRTREDIVRDLKNKRAKGGADESTPAPAPIVDKALEEAKREGKFKPIGFKPIGASSKAKEGKELKKKKKRKVVEAESSTKVSEVPPSAAIHPSTEKSESGVASASSTQNVGKKSSIPEQEPEPVEDDFDIFAGAGEYEGINLDDEDEGDDTTKREIKRSETIDTTVSAIAASTENAPRRKWFDDDEPQSPPPERSLPDTKGKRKDTSTSTPPEYTSQGKENGEIEDETPTESVARLAPLASSAVPSIRDILAADSALEAENKRRARKEKRKGGKGKGGGGDSDGEGKKTSAEAKLNRDYQKLKSFTDKKKGS